MRVSETQIQTFTNAVLKATGVVALQRASVVRNIVWNELDGRKNFGLQRLPTYVARLQAGGINPSAHPKVKQLAGASASIDGDNGFGQYAGEVAMAEAIVSAREFGIGISTVRDSNFFGSGAYFVNQACEAGMIGFAMSNSFPKVAAHEGKRPVLGTNPFAFGVPMSDGNALVADFATSALAGSTIREYLDRRDPFPPGSIAAKTSEDGLVLATFGGSKGFSMALLVEILSGVLSGAGVSDGVNSMYRNLSKPGENGHALIAINIAAWGPPEIFLARMESFRQHIIGSDTTRLPGENRIKLRTRHRKTGVDISEKMIAALDDVAESLELTKLQSC